MPADISLLHVIAVALLFGAWAAYSPILAAFGKGTLNTQLMAVRRRWIRLATERDNPTFDSVLFGHLVNSVAFFGSATLIVLAALVSALAGVTSVHSLVSELPGLDPMTVELFAVKLLVLVVALTNSFFSFTLSLRKLLYTLALIGALPHQPPQAAGQDPAAEARAKRMIDATAAVMTDALKAFNNGIRGYYFALAGLFLFLGPWPCIVATLLVLSLLLVRQTVTVTSRAIGDYVEAQDEMERKKA